MKVEKKSYEQHPEGWYLFCTGEPEQVTSEYQGKVKTRLKWPCTSMERNSDGDSFVVNVFTGMELTDHKMDVHRQLVSDGFGIDTDDYEDTDEITGKFFAGKVEHKKDTGRASIVQFDTKDRIKPKPKSSKAAPVDPFENE